MRPPPAPNRPWELGSHGGTNSGSHTGKIPKLDFPKFDGECPKSWLKNCEDYFDLYSVEPPIWIKVATMHFVPSSDAARWKQSIEDELPSMTWPSFRTLLLERFGRDEHEILVRKLFQIRMTATVNEYITQITTLIDQLNAYAKHPDPIYYVQRFIEGLRDDIKAVVLLQRPTSLDTACVLARLQEEVSVPRRPLRRMDGNQSFKYPTAGAHPLPLPPVKPAGGVENRPNEPVKMTTPEEKYQALREHRRAQGLCFKCGAKWFRGHHCAPMIHLNVVQEIYDLFQSSDDNVDAQSVQSAPDHQLMLHLSTAAVTGCPSPKTMCLLGSLQGHPISILVDSGSSHTFLSTKLSPMLQGVCPLSQPIQVQVANGAVLSCSTYIPQAQWSVQGYNFVTDLKLLPLPSHDMILGLDWL